MAASRTGHHELVNVFEVAESYLFMHTFDGDAVFDRLQAYYDNQQYRFEVPWDEFDELQSFLAAHGYDLTPVQDISRFAVVVRKYTAHPEDIFKTSVLQRSIDGYNCFLLRDRFAVAQAVAEGATPLTNTDLEDPF